MFAYEIDMYELHKRSTSLSVLLYIGIWWLSVKLLRTINTKNFQIQNLQDCLLCSLDEKIIDAS